MRQAFTLCCCLLCALLASCGDEGRGKGEARPAPVRVAQAVRQDVPRTLETVGTVQASSSVEVRARVTGEIAEVCFTEGEDVREGQVLLRIDSRPYEAALREAQGNLAQSEARMRKARRDAGRYARLAEGGYVSRDACEQMATEAAADEAAVRAGRAAVERAALDVAYCTLAAPISGRAGELALHRGNMVRSTETAMLRIDALSPCHVYFSVPERHLPAVQERMRAGMLRVKATPRGGRPVEGLVGLVDSAVDTATGTIRLRAEFPNEDRALWPGQFVEISLLLGEEPGALTVPAEAILDGEGKRYVYVVRDGRARYRAVRELFTGGGLAVLASGVEEGELVVTEGQMRLAPDMPVKVSEKK